MLRTTGRASGLPREARLYAFADGPGLVVVGSWGGRPSDPHWARNLRADPRARVRIGRREQEMIAREVEGAERERLWSLVAGAFPLYEAYQRRTSRRIPLFKLEPDAEDVAGG